MYQLATNYKNMSRVATDISSNQSRERGTQVKIPGAFRGWEPTLKECQLATNTLQIQLYDHTSQNHA